MEYAEAENLDEQVFYSSSALTETSIHQKLIMLKLELPWISSVLNGNETISLLSGKYIRIYTVEIAVQNYIETSFCARNVHTFIKTRK